MGSRVACIDVGTNTTRLLVAELGARGTVRPLLEERASTTPGTAEHLRAVIARQADVARVAGAGRLRVVGTAMVRARPGLAAMLRDAAPAAPLEVLEPAEEARLAFAGATQGLRHDGDVAVLDVGGGSTELAVGRPGGGGDGVHWSASAQLGSRALCESCDFADPPTPAQLQEAADRAAAALAALACPHRPTLALAAGGSAATTARLVGPRLHAAALDRVLALLCASPAAAVAAQHGLDPERARILPAGLVLLREAGAALGVALQVGAGGLREGVVLDLLGATG